MTERQYCEHQATHEQLVVKAKEVTPAIGYINIMCQILKLLGDPTRMKIIYSLLNGEMCVLHLAEHLNMGQSAVSHQLRILRSSGLVRPRREGKTVYYALDDDHVREILEAGLEHILHK